MIYIYIYIWGSNISTLVQTCSKAWTPVSFGIFHKLVVLFVGVLMVRALLLGVYIGAPDFWKLPPMGFVLMYPHFFMVLGRLQDPSQDWSPGFREDIVRTRTLGAQSPVYWVEVSGPYVRTICQLCYLQTRSLLHGCSCVPIYKLLLVYYAHNPGTYARGSWAAKLDAVVATLSCKS